MWCHWVYHNGLPIVCESSYRYFIYFSQFTSIAQYAWDYLNGTNGDLAWGFGLGAITGDPDVYPTYAPSSLAWTPTNSLSPFIEVIEKITSHTYHSLLSTSQLSSLELTFLLLLALLASIKSNVQMALLGSQYGTALILRNFFPHPFLTFSITNATIWTPPITPVTYPVSQFRFDADPYILLGIDAVKIFSANYPVSNNCFQLQNTSCTYLLSLPFIFLAVMQFASNATVSSTSTKYGNYYSAEYMLGPPQYWPDWCAYSSSVWAPNNTSPLPWAEVIQLEIRYNSQVVGSDTSHCD